MVFGITGKFRTGKRQVRSTRFDTLQNVIFEFALERFFIDNANFVLRTKTFINVLDFNGNVRTNFTFDHEARIVVQRRRRPQACLSATFGIILFAIALEANIHGALEHELRLVETKVLHPCRHVHRNRNIKDRTCFRRLVAIVLPDKPVKPKTLAPDIVHVRNVICKFRIMRGPKDRRIRARKCVHTFFRHVNFTSSHINIVRENLALRSIHESRACTHTTKRQ